MSLRGCKYIILGLVGGPTRRLTLVIVISMHLQRRATTDGWSFCPTLPATHAFVEPLYVVSSDGTHTGPYCVYLPTTQKIRPEELAPRQRPKRYLVQRPQIWTLRTLTSNSA